MEGMRGAERVGTPRSSRRGDGRTKGGTHATREGQNPPCIRSGRGLDWRTYAANKGREIGSMTMFTRSTTDDREERCEHRTWWIGWGRWFENMRWIWRTGRLRWSMWKGWACSKWKTKSGKVDKDAKDLVDRHDRKSHLFPLLGTYWWMCGLVGADVMKIFVHRGKTKQSERKRNVQHCTCT